jgi:hypothetical protein
MKQQTHCTAWMGLAILLLTGCGGGGSAPSAPPPVTSFPVSAVVTSLATKGGAFSGSRVDAEGNQFKLNVVYAADGTGRFTRKETLLTNGVSGSPVSIGFNFNPTAALFSILGWTDAKGTAAVLNENNALPAMASIGSSGAWFAGSVSGPAQETLLLTYRWSLEAVSDSTANLCLQMGYLSGLTGTSDTDCFRIDASGTIQAFKSTKELRKSSLVTQHVYQ